MTIKDQIQENSKDIEKLYDHAKVANHEMGVIKNDIAWIKEVLEKVETRTWYILATIILGFVLNIVFQVYR